MNIAVVFNSSGVETGYVWEKTTIKKINTIAYVRTVQSTSEIKACKTIVPRRLSARTKLIIPSTSTVSGTAHMIAKKTTRRTWPTMSLACLSSFRKSPFSRAPAGSAARMLATNKAHRPRRRDELGVVDVVTWLFLQDNTFKEFDNLGSRCARANNVAQRVFHG